MITELKVLGSLFVGSIVAIPVVGTVGANSDTLNGLATGSVQMVLAIVVLGLAGAIIWTTKRLLKSMEDRVSEAKTNQEQGVQEAKDARDTIQKVVADNSVAMANNATASQQLKESVYHLASVVDRVAAKEPTDRDVAPPSATVRKNLNEG